MVGRLLQGRVSDIHSCALREGWNSGCQRRVGADVGRSESVVIGGLVICGNRSEESMYREAPSPGLCLRPASPVFALVVVLIVVLPRPLLFCGGLELSKVVEEFVVLAVTLAAEAMSCRWVLARSYRRLEKS